MLLDMFVLRGIPFGCGRGRARSDGPARAGGGVTWGVGQVVHRDGASVDSDQHRGAAGRPAAASSSRRAAPGPHLPRSVAGGCRPALAAPRRWRSAPCPGTLLKLAVASWARMLPGSTPTGCCRRRPHRELRLDRLAAASWPGCSRSRSWQRGCFAGGPQPLAEAPGMTSRATCDGSGRRAWADSAGPS